MNGPTASTSRAVALVRMGVALILTPLFAWACGSKSPSETDTGPHLVQLLTDQASYARGAEVAVTVQNISEQSVSYNLCLRHLEHRQNGGWERVATEPVNGAGCLDVLHALKPGEAAKTGFAIPPTAVPGTYRIHIPDLPAGDQLTPPFAVTDPTD